MISDYLKFSALKHQVEGIRYALNHNYSINGDEMGLGKTFEALAVAEVTELPTAIICPAYLKYTWANEVNKFCKDPDYKILTPKDYDKTPTEKYLILSYGQLGKCHKSIRGRKFIVGDEIHYAKTPTSHRTIDLHDILEGMRPERFLGMSGTPVKNRVQEWYSILSLCDYNIYKNSGKKILDEYYSYWKWCEEFCYKTSMEINGRTIRKFWGLRNKDHLRSFLQGKYIRRLAKDVLDLPDIVTKDVIVSYRNDKDLEAAWESHKTGAEGYFSTAKKESAIAKASFTAEYSTNIREETGEPVVIFTCHPDVILKIRESLNKKYQIGVINADVKPEDRQKVVDLFQAGNLDFLISTIETGSTGYTMTKASDLVQNDLDWVPGNNRQARKRIHRIGQNKRCTIHNILGSKVDIKILKTLTEKERDLEELL